MRAVRVREYGPPEVLVAEELPDPRPDVGQVIVGVATVGVNFVEMRLCAGTSARSGSPTRPFVPGNEVGGVVLEVGRGVDPALEGRRVVTATGGKGAYAERVAVAADELVEIPEELEIETAVALFAQGRTAVGLVRETRPAPDEHVLVEAAAGGVGSLLVQLTKEAGATVFAAARGDRKLRLARELGADVTVDYAQPDWVEKLRDATDDAGLDVVFDSVGGDTGRQAFGLLAGGGRCAMFGFASGSSTEASSVEILRRGVTVIGFGGPRLLQRPEYARELEYEALREAAAGWLVPIIGQKFALERAAEAHASIENRATVGKTLLVP